MSYKLGCCLYLCERSNDPAFGLYGFGLHCFHGTQFVRALHTANLSTLCPVDNVWWSFTKRNLLENVISNIWCLIFVPVSISWTYVGFLHFWILLCRNHNNQCPMDCSPLYHCVITLAFCCSRNYITYICFIFSIGRVNPQLYALGAGTWNFEDSVGNSQSHSKLEQWMLNYANVLCTNSWQVLL